MILTHGEFDLAFRELRTFHRRAEACGRVSRRLSVCQAPIGSIWLVTSAFTVTHTVVWLLFVNSGVCGVD